MADPSSSSGYLFVSYSRWDRKDKPLIDQLLSDLRADGVNLWLVPDDIPPGVDWREAKPEGLRNASGILYLFGRPLNKTHQIADELEFALSNHLPIFTAIITERASRALEEYAVPGGAFETVFLANPVVSLLNNYEAGLSQLLDLLPSSVKRSRLGSAEAVDVMPKSKGYVFISYAEEDTDFVEKLRNFLAGKGYGYWDYQASDRNFHTQLFLELEEVIQNAAATLSVLSPDWKKSAWAAKEYLFSEEVGTPVFLLMARAIGPTLVTAGVPYIDFTHSEATGFERLDRELRRKGLI